MNTEEWIESNSKLASFPGEYFKARVIRLSDLLDLLEDHVIIPREASHKVQELIILERSSEKHSVDFYKAIIDAAEKDDW